MPNWWLQDGRRVRLPSRRLRRNNNIMTSESWRVWMNAMEMTFCRGPHLTHRSTVLPYRHRTACSVWAAFKCACPSRPRFHEGKMDGRPADYWAMIECMLWAFKINNRLHLYYCKISARVSTQFRWKKNYLYPPKSMSPILADWM